MPPRGLLIAFEGIDGSGKQTQIRLLKKALRRRRPAVMRYPDLKGAYGKALNAFLLGKKRLTARQQFSLFADDIAKDKGRIERRVASGKTIILDRFIASTVAYQAAGGIAFSDAARKAQRLALPAPDLIVLLDLAPEEALARKRRQKASAKQALHEFEKKRAFQKRVRRNYLLLARKRFLARKWLVVDASLPPARIHAKIKAQIRALVKR